MKTIDDGRTALLEARAYYERLIAQIDAALEWIIPETSDHTTNETKVGVPTGITVKRKRHMSAAARREVSDRMKKYWADRRKKRT